MFLHNLKISFRNLMKYKLQNAISILALAVGIVTLAATHIVLRNIQLPYVCEEAHYDRSYVLDIVDNSATKTSESKDETETGSSQVTPEIASALWDNGEIAGVEQVIRNHKLVGQLMSRNMNFYQQDGNKIFAVGRYYESDSEKLNFYGIRSALTGEKIPVLMDNEVVLCENYARAMFGEQNPVGCNISTLAIEGGEIVTLMFTVRDVYKNEKTPEDILVDAMFINFANKVNTCDNYLLVLKDGYKSNDVLQEANRRLAPLGVNARITPLKEVMAPTVQRIVMMRTVTYILGALILLSAMIGFLKMQLQLFRMRSREVSLRRIHGASNHSIYNLFSGETIVVLLLAAMLGLLLINMLRNYTLGNLLQILSVRHWSIDGINITLICITGMTVLMSLVVVASNTRAMLRTKQSLSAQMHKSRNHALRNVMLGLQLSICILFMGGTLCIMQLVNLYKVNCNIPHNENVYKQCIELGVPKEGAEKIYDYLSANQGRIDYHLLMGNRFLFLNGDLDFKQFSIDVVRDTSYFSFWQLPVKWMVSPNERRECLIVSDSTYVKLSRAGLITNNVFETNGYEPLRIGGTYGELPYKVKSFGITQEGIYISDHDDIEYTHLVVQPKRGYYEAVFGELAALMDQINPHSLNKQVSNVHEGRAHAVVYYENIQHIVHVLTAISVIVCLMGVWSNIALDCRSRRKEVALRKVHGAKRWDIILMFSRLYLWLLGIAGIVCIAPIIMFNNLTIEKAGLYGFSADSLTPTLPILGSIGITAAVVTLIVGVHIRKVMNVKPANMIAKE